MKLKVSIGAVAFAVGLLCAPLIGSAPGLAYLDIANVFSANQRINAGLGLNVAPGATGTLSASAGIFERSRAAGLGAWTSVAYSGANFTASAGTWTVDSGDQVVFRYALVGTTMLVSVNLQTTSVSSTPAQLLIAIPGGCTSVNLWRFPNAVLSDAGSPFTAGQIAANAGGTTMIFFPNVGASGTWTASTNATSIVANFSFEVSGC